MLYPKIPLSLHRFSTKSHRVKRLKGEMVEWSITAVLKTAVLRGTGGSNPSLSAETAFLEQNKVSKHQLNAVILTSYGVFRYSFPRVTDNVKTP